VPQPWLEDGPFGLIRNSLWVTIRDGLEQPLLTSFDILPRFIPNTPGNVTHREFVLSTRIAWIYVSGQIFKVLLI